MRFEDLSPADQALVNTDFGGLDKVAAEQVKVAAEMYNAGAEMALSTADQMDKLAAESEKEDEEDEMEEEEKKASIDYGNIIAEGFIDKLAELGEERHGNPAHYVMPYVEEKIAQVGAQAALEKFAKSKAGFLTSLGAKAKGAVKSVSDFGKKTMADTKAAVTGTTARGKELSAMDRVKKLKNPAMVAGGLAGVGGAGYATNKLMSKKKES